MEGVSFAGKRFRLYAGPTPSIAMAMLNGRSAPSSDDLNLDPRLCADLGAEFTRVRDARGLSIAQVAERLLLSNRQVKALEKVEFTAFHNATFHLSALRKYAAFLGVDASLVDKIGSGLVKPDPQAVMLVPSESSDDAAESSSGRMLSIAGTLLAVAVLAGGGFYLAQSRGVRPPSTAAAARPAPVPAAPARAPEPVPAPPPVVVEPAVVPAADVASSVTQAAAPVPAQPAPDSSGFGMLRVLHPTWIFVRDTDNAVIERSLAQGETFVFDAQPNYLAVGTADAELSIGSRKVDVSKFVANGQLRIRAGDFDALVQGASPIQAPTPAVRR